MEECQSLPDVSDKFGTVSHDTGTGSLSGNVKYISSNLTKINGVPSLPGLFYGIVQYADSAYSTKA